MNNNMLIYLDNNASTPVDPQVFELMKRFFLIEYGNPHSNTHAFGRNARHAIEKAQNLISDFVGANAEEVVFTSGATEANNLALNGLANGWGTGRPRIIVSKIEHPSVLEPALILQNSGWEVEFLPVDNEGYINLHSLEAKLRDRPCLLSIGLANGEIGTIQPIKEIARLCGLNDAVFHCDASQAVGKIPVGLYEDSIDLLTLSAHKMYGPKGIGALIIRNSLKKHLKPQITGGGQQDHLRSGTLPTPLCVGFGEACRISRTLLNSDALNLSSLQSQFLDHLSESGLLFKINGPAESRLPGNINISIPEIDTNRLMTTIPHLAFSSSSACSSQSKKVSPSHVLQAIGLSASEMRSSFRMGIGRFNSQNDIKIAANSIIDAINNLK